MDAFLSPKERGFEKWCFNHSIFHNPFPLLAQLFFAYEQALLQWKPMEENLCKHDFPSFSFN